MSVAEIVAGVPARATAGVAERLRPAFRQIAAWRRAAADPLAFLIRSLALASGVLGVWRLGNDLGWTQDFFIAAGVGSHWQIWLALAAALNAAANFIQRAARRTRAESH
jgi:hypothetical protein